MEILTVKHLKKYYDSGENLVKALDDVSFSLHKGEFTAIVGTSGSGKSTLLNMMGGLDTPSNGEVIIEGKTLNNLKGDELTIFRRKRIGFIFQNFNLIPILTVKENIVLPVCLDGQKVDEAYVNEILNFLKIEDKMNAFPNKLSGGQQQRAAIARALSNKPAILLADEPTGNLDKNTSMEVIRLLQTTSKKFNQTIVLITHDPSIAENADRIIRIEDGRWQKDDFS